MRSRRRASRVESAPEGVLVMVFELFRVRSRPMVDGGARRSFRVPLMVAGSPSCGGDGVGSASGARPRLDLR